MSYQADIYAAVLAAPSLVALIGDRFSWDIADGDTVAPYIVAQTISDGSETAHDRTRSLAFPIIQVSCWAKTKAESIALARAWKIAIEGVELPGTSKTSIGFTNENSSYDSETKLYGTLLDYRASTTTT